MIQTAAQKLNIPEESEGYVRIPYPLASRKNGMTGAGLMLYAFVFSRSCLKNDPAAVCRASYTDFMQTLGIGSRSTPSKELERLEESGLIERRKRFHAKTEYSIPDGDASLPVIEAENYFFNHKFYIPKEECSRKLRPFEALILALIATHTKNPETKRFEGSISQISGMLGVCEKTVRMALDVLSSAKLVRCHERYFRASYQKTLHLHAAKAIVRTMRHKRRKTVQEPRRRRSEAELAVIAINEHSARSSYYGILRQRAAEKADHYQRILEQDERYAELQRKTNALIPQIARAQIDEEKKGKPGNSAKLQKEYDRLREQMLEIMTKMKISPPMLEANTYCRCKKCSDTGRLPSGRPCDCYPASKEDEM